MNCKYALALLTFAALACGTVTPIAPSEPTRIPDAQIAAPLPTAAPVLVDATPYVVTITADVLNIRSCASTSCEAVGALGKGDHVEPLDRVLNEKDNRCRVWYEIEGGYICEAFTVKP